MVKCKRCGKCCTWFPIAYDSKDIPPKIREYCMERADAYDEGFFIISATCRHLVLSSDEDVSKGLPPATCDIYKKRPAICRTFHGQTDRNKDGTRFYMPPGCAYGVKK